MYNNLYSFVFLLKLNNHDYYNLEYNLHYWECCRESVTVFIFRSFYIIIDICYILYIYKVCKFWLIFLYKLYDNIYVYVIEFICLIIFNNDIYIFMIYLFYYHHFLFFSTDPFYFLVFWV